MNKDRNEETVDILLFCNTLNAHTGYYRHHGDDTIAYVLEHAQTVIMKLLDETGRLEDTKQHVTIVPEKVMYFVPKTPH